MAVPRRKRGLPRQGRVRLGVIGGSGLYQMPGLEGAREIRVRTPFGDPSDALVVGSLGAVGVVFLPRHGRGHRLLPSEINFRANLYAMKRLGVEFLISVGAVGSLREGIHPGDIVVVDQFIDKTDRRPSTFFGDGLVAHVGFADPTCPSLSRLVVDAGRVDAGANVHDRGTYVCMEGPQFSTRAESELHRTWGADVIGMTAVQEAKLAREAEMCFASVALVTDYDCWNSSAGDVEIAEVLRILDETTDRARAIVRAVAARLPERRPCACASALEQAIITERSRISAKVRRRLGPMVDKYLSAGGSRRAR